MLTLLEKAIETRDIKSLNVIPEKMLSHFLSQLPEEKLKQYQSIKNSQSAICHDPKNPYWDLSKINDGDRARHKVTGKIGTIKIYRGSLHEWDDQLKVIHKEDFFTMSSFMPIIDIEYEDGTQGSVYPNQIERI